MLHKYKLSPTLNNLKIELHNLTYHFSKTPYFRVHKIKIKPMLLLTKDLILVMQDQTSLPILIFNLKLFQRQSKRSRAHCREVHTIRIQTEPIHSPILQILSKRRTIKVQDKITNHNFLLMSKAEKNCIKEIGST